MDELVEWVVFTALLATALPASLWMAGAIYYDVCGAGRWARLAAVAWFAGVAAVFVFWQPIWQPFVALLGVLAGFLTWWGRLMPSHNREWEPAVAVLPRAVRDGDAVAIESVRDFDYHTLDDFTPRYETRTYHLSNLRGVDVIFFNWGASLMSHPVLVFDFGPDGRICFSIEVRFRKGQQFSIIRSLYRQQELIFVAADERDIILRRTKYGRPQKGLLYRMIVPAHEIRAAFLAYVAAIDNLFERPQWYHGLWANCTTSYYRLPGRRCWIDWRVVANGRLDRALYEAGRLDRSLPFDELRRVAYINDAANNAPQDGFGDYVRCELQRRRNER